MPQSRSYLFKQRSEYVEYQDVSQGTTIEINIPRLQRTYLTKDSYLKFNIATNVSSGSVQSPKVLSVKGAVPSGSTYIPVYISTTSTLKANITTATNTLTFATADLAKLKAIVHAGWDLVRIPAGTVDTEVYSITSEVTGATDPSFTIDETVNGWSTTDTFTFVAPDEWFKGLVGNPISGTGVLTLGQRVTATMPVYDADGILQSMEVIMNYPTTAALVDMANLIVTFTPSGQIYLDRSGIYGMIDRIEVYDYMGSTLLERTSGVADLMGILLDMNSNMLEQQDHFRSIAGTGIGNIDVAGVSIDKPFTSRVMNSSLGDMFADINSTSATTSYVARQFAIPIPSFLGLFSNKYCPLHNGFTVKIVLNNPTYAMIATGEFQPNASISNTNISGVEFCSQVLELGPEAEGMVMSSLQGQPVAIHSKSYRLFKDVINGATTSNPQSSFRLDLDLNVISLTNLIWCMKPLQYYENTKGELSPIPSASLQFQNIGQRIRNQLLRWNFQYGSSYLPNVNGIQCKNTLLPTKSVTGASTIQEELSKVDLEVYMELLKSFHSLNSDSFPTSISREEFTKNFYDINTVLPVNYPSYVQGYACPKFVAGLDLELVSGKSREVICGMNTNGLNTCINGYFDQTKLDVKSVDSVVSALLLCWTEYDSFVNILPGVASTVSF